MVGATSPAVGRGLGSVSPTAAKLLVPKIVFGGIHTLNGASATIEFPYPLTGNVADYVCQCMSIGVPARMAVDNLMTNSVQVMGDVENATFNWVVIKIN